MSSPEPDLSSQGTTSGFNALAATEGLLEGVVAFVTALLWCLCVLPLLFFAKRPFSAIAQACMQKKPLPPLVFNFVGVVPILVFVAYQGRLMSSLDRRGEWQAVWRTLSAEDTGQFLFIAGPPVAALWLFVAVAARVLERFTTQPREHIRFFLLYFMGMLTSYLSLGVFLIFSATQQFGARERLFPIWFAELGVEFFTRVAPLLLLFALLAQIWREIKLKFAGSLGHTKVLITLLVCGVLLGLAAAAGALCEASWRFMESLRAEWVTGAEPQDMRARGPLSVDAQRCRLDATYVTCTLLMHASSGRDVRLLDVATANLMTSRPSVTGKSLQMSESNIEGLVLKPAVNEGDALVLAGGQQGHLNVRVPARTICEHPGPGVPGEAYFLRFYFVGVVQGAATAKGMDLFDPVQINLDDALVKEARLACARDVRRAQK